MSLASAGARSLIERLDALRSRDEVLVFKQQCYELVPRGVPRLLDVGSGTGDDALALSERLGPDTEIVGVETLLELVEEAKRRARNVALNVRFLESELLRLPFLDGAFPVVRADGVLSRGLALHALLSELLRVLAPQGTLLLHECVWPLDEPTHGSALDSLAHEIRDILSREHSHTTFVLHELDWAGDERQSRVLERAATATVTSGFSFVLRKAEGRASSR